MTTTRPSPPPPPPPPTTTQNPPPPPPSQWTDDEGNLLVTRLRPSPIKHFLRLFHGKTARSKHVQDPPPEVEAFASFENGDSADLKVVLYHPPVLDEDYSVDVYRWAVLYENQRGLTVFSTRYYSPLSLLPHDPPPYTVPSAAPSRTAQPTITSPATYPLPDATWHWVSRAWLVDMSADGHVQYDGFEYNWCFRRDGWRPCTGFASAGGLVRRRRWVRLMVRPKRAADPVAPAHASARASESAGSTPKGSGASTPATSRFLGSAGIATRPPSVSGTVASVEVLLDAADAVWTGEAADDWTRCHAAMLRVGRDGRMLELWQRWLGCTAPPDATMHPVDTKLKEPRTGPGSHRQWWQYSDATERTNADPFVGDPARVAAVISAHAREILAAFIYPDSRARLLALFEYAGFSEEVSTGLGAPGIQVAASEFWSYGSGLNVLTEEREDE